MPQPERPNRQSIRKRGWDYTAPGYYFVTCNTSRLVVGCLNPQGMLACLLSEADPEMEIVYL